MKNWIRGTAVLSVAAAAVLGWGLTASASSQQASVPRAVHPAVSLATGVGGQTFVPIAPCRIANTHIAATRFIGVNGARDFYVRGTGAGFAAQGGTAGGCGIPDDATSVVTTVNATASTVLPIYLSGYLLGYPTGGAVPTANFLAFKNGGTSGNPTLTLAAAGTEPSLTIKSLGGVTEVAIDVTGYYADLVSLSGQISGGSSTVLPSIISGSPGILSVTRNSTRNDTVNVASDVSGCTPLVSASLAGLQTATASIAGSHAIQVNLNSLIGGLPTDGTFTLNVLC